MMMSRRGPRDPDAVRVPGWVKGAVVAAATIGAMGYKLGAKVQSHLEEVQSMHTFERTIDFRLCRLEQASGIVPYEGCYRLEGALRDVRPPATLPMPDRAP